MSSNRLVSIGSIKAFQNRNHAGEDNMYFSHEKSTRPGESRLSVTHQGIAYRDLYQSIDGDDDLSAAQLLYLKRLVEKKLKAFDPRIDSADLEMKPYAVEEDIGEEWRQISVSEKEKGASFSRQTSAGMFRSRKERRRYPRRRVMGTVIARVHPSLLPAGTVIDISRGGVAFKYREKGRSLHEIRELDIIWADFVAAHQLRGLPVQTVSDVVLDGKIHTGGIVARRRAVRFRNLSGRQKFALDRLVSAQGVPAA
jgi:hypothetical protein